MSKRKDHKIAPGVAIGQYFPAKITTSHVSSPFPPTQTFLSSSNRQETDFGSLEGIEGE